MQYFLFKKYIINVCKISAILFRLQYIKANTKAEASLTGQMTSKTNITDVGFAGHLIC